MKIQQTIMKVEKKNSVWNELVYVTSLQNVKIQTDFSQIATGVVRVFFNIKWKTILTVVNVILFSPGNL